VKSVKHIGIKFSSLMRTCLLLLLMVLIVSCKDAVVQNNNNAEKVKSLECIDRIIQRDEKLSKIRNYSCESLSLSESINNYLEELDKLDYSNCPPSFKVTFFDHITAWENMLVVTDEYPEPRGEMFVLFESIGKGDQKKELKKLLKELWYSWDIVLDELEHYDY